MAVKNDKLTKEEILGWIKALRSGDYKQTQYRLSDGKGHCCLGVLAEHVYGYSRDYLKTEKKSGGPNAIYSKLFRNLDTYKIDADDLIHLNDGKKDFNQIADYIEDKLQGV
jgi:hypothetical protein